MLPMPCYPLLFSALFSPRFLPPRVQGRRDAWAAEKTRELKELTIRGLEPEVQRLVAAHREEARLSSSPPPLASNP